MHAAARRHLCGVQTAWTENPEAAAAVADCAAAIGGSSLAQLVVFFSTDYDVEVLAAALSSRFPGVPTIGCTTSGGICPAGAIERGLVVLAFPTEGFRTATAALPDVAQLDVEGAARTIRDLRTTLDGACAGRPPAQRFALMLIDGLSNVEESVVSTVTWALDGIPLVGGSAGDDLRFHDTRLVHDGVVLRGAAVVLLVETDYPIQLFKTDNFDPTDKKFVVTHSDDETRTVFEFNAEPAAHEYAMAVGLDPRHLTPMSFAAHPLVVKIGGEYFCRSIRHTNPDGSLSFFCAISEGVVMTLAEPRDIVQATREELARLERSLGMLDLVIGFDCVLRRLDAEQRQVRREISDLYRQYNVAGFETYGEQYRSMHLNQTFTGIAIGLACA